MPARNFHYSVWFYRTKEAPASFICFPTEMFTYGRGRGARILAGTADALSLPAASVFPPLPTPCSQNPSSSSFHNQAPALDALPPWSPMVLVPLSLCHMLLCLIYLLKNICIKTLFYYSWFTMSCQFLLYSKVTQLYIYIHAFCHIILHVPSQVIRNSSLCYTAGSHCLSIPDAIVCIY